MWNVYQQLGVSGRGHLTCATRLCAYRSVFIRENRSSRIKRALVNNLRARANCCLKRDGARDMRDICFQSVVNDARGKIRRVRAVYDAPANQ